MLWGAYRHQLSKYFWYIYANEQKEWRIHKGNDTGFRQDMLDYRWKI